MRKLFWLIIGFIFGGLLVILLDQAFALDRCKQYIPIIRTQHYKYFGLDFPYEYGVGQAQVESNCRADVVSFDGGEGLTQFMPRTKIFVESYIGSFDIFNPFYAIKAQAWYMSYLHSHNPSSKLWVTYSFYNSGEGTIKREKKLAGSYDYEKMKAVCKRKKITLKDGSILDFCKVGYSYPQKVRQYGLQYNPFLDANKSWRFWN